MNTPPAITCLFIDIGGVLLTNGWDHITRKQAASHFKLDWEEMEERHQLNFAIYEEGRLSLDRYLSRTIFHEQRSFSVDQFQSFMFVQSHPFPDMIELFRSLKAQYGLKIVVVSNEARELNAYRIRKFKLDELVDAFISSCFIHLRKPDEAIFQLALDIAQQPASQIVFIDNTKMFVQIAENLGMNGIHHTDYTSTCVQLAAFGLRNTADSATALVNSA
ncbi:hydrolase [Methylomonas lenta]|uniref:Hydrolase n=1 Tax=Methylomonas lenta TaxID=980561 RepID=A0A177NC45_9GAMM|nr:HAD family hydrolase [Methylomonas lenta]OAI15587.1 hydrolase [Methylomonas lenta]